MHGWDGGEQTWYGPSDLIAPTNGQSRQAIRLSTLHSGFSGKVVYEDPDYGPVPFSAMIQDNGEAGVAIVGSEHLADGPLQVVAVLPRTRLPRLRPDFAFEFVASLRFLGIIDAGSELPVHDYIESITKQPDENCSQVFAIGRHLPLREDVAIPLSCLVESFSVSMLKWLTTKDALV